MKGREDITPDGVRISIHCNISSAADLEAVLDNDGRGIGLFRSEFIYLASSDFPDEESQFLAYRKVIESMEGKRVVIRTLDIGADKQAEYFGMKKEENPAMGMRAVRFCLTHPEVFRTQLRALLRAGVYGNLYVMIPMVSSVSEVMETRAIIDELCSELASQGFEYLRKLPLGVMIETPSSAMIAADLSKVCDFFSIGTNDLVQYTRAIDRGNEHVAYLYHPAHPSVLKMIKSAVDGAKVGGIPVAVCGQMAADPALAVLLTGLGVHELSMVESAIPLVRRVIRSVSMYEAVQAAEKALKCATAAEVGEIVAVLLKERCSEFTEV
jgi:phosphotransferase system enzyme I (PtsI)